MPIDLSHVNWIFVVLVGVFAFVSALIGNLLSIRSRFGASVIAGVLFAIIYVAWNYYPHPTIPLPTVTAYSTPAG